ELARVLGRGAFPARAGELAAALRRDNAPDPLVDAVAGLPRAERFGNVQQLAEALAGGR
ncbi:DUF2795 domain-containing protein, partial [Streptomyces sp. NPDC004561]